MLHLPVHAFMVPSHVAPPVCFFFCFFFLFFFIVLVFIVFTCTFGHKRQGTYQCSVALFFQGTRGKRACEERRGRETSAGGVGGFWEEIDGTEEKTTQTASNRRRANVHGETEEKDDRSRHSTRILHRLLLFVDRHTVDWVSFFSPSFVIDGKIGTGGASSCKSDWCYLCKVCKVRWWSLPQLVCVRWVFNFKEKAGSVNGVKRFHEFKRADPNCWGWGHWVHCMCVCINASSIRRAMEWHIFLGSPSNSGPPNFDVPSEGREFECEIFSEKDIMENLLLLPHLPICKENVVFHYPLDGNALLYYPPPPIE